MGLIQEQQGLTVLKPTLEAARRASYPGMAHFAGSGPQSKTCRECLSWTNCGPDPGYYAAKGIRAGALKPRACEKYRAMMDNIGPGVPHDASACKHFTENSTPPAISAKRA